MPLGKLRNDRYVPLHPELVELLTAWTAANLEHIGHHKRLIADRRGPLDRYLIGRIAARGAIDEAQVLQADGGPSAGRACQRARHARHSVKALARAVPGGRLRAW